MILKSSEILLVTQHIITKTFPSFFEPWVLTWSHMCPRELIHQVWCYVAFYIMKCVWDGIIPFWMLIYTVSNDIWWMT